jgi:hypothetical protein
MWSSLTVNSVIVNSKLCLIMILSSKPCCSRGPLLWLGNNSCKSNRLVNLEKGFSLINLIYLNATNSIIASVEYEQFCEPSDPPMQ